jgi:hypothetical protein
MPMKHQMIGTLGVTIAFTAGAVCTALVLDIPSVQAYLGLATHDVADWYRSGASYFGIAVFSGLLVDAVRFLSAKWSGERPQARRDIEKLFRRSLA